MFENASRWLWLWLVAGSVTLLSCAGPADDVSPTAQDSQAAQDEDLVMTSSPVVLTVSEVTEIQETLQEGSREEIMDLLAIPDDADSMVEVDQGAVDQVLDLVQDLELHPDSVSALGEDEATVLGDINGTQWLIYLVRTGETWQIAVTAEQDTP